MRVRDGIWKMGGNLRVDDGAVCEPSPDEIDEGRLAG